MQDETLEWVKRPLNGNDLEYLVVEFGEFLKTSRSVDEPTLEEIAAAIKE